MAILPLDIITSEILPRLPPITLLRFKSINKLFYDYISSKQFINHHLHHSVSSNTNSPVIVFSAPRYYKHCLYTLDVNSDDFSFRYLPLPPPFSLNSARVVGSCNGLLCLNFFNSQGGINYWIVLNPCTGEVSNNISISYSDKIPQQTYNGFGYDSLNDDYKAVVVEYYFDVMNNNGNGYNAARMVRVFSMKENSWRCVENNTDIFISDIRVRGIISNCEIIHNNLLHWLPKFLIGTQTNRRIACFDLRNEQWGADLELPEFNEYNCRFACLGIVDGCLCLFVGNYDITSANNVWIMKEYGVQESWTKFSIDVPHHCYRGPYFGHEKGSVEMLDNTSKKFVLSGGLYNLEVKSLCIRSLVTGFGVKRMEIDKQVNVLLEEQ
ncbi:F-box protein CPR1 [Bienertia sinuspersici]